jgi:hypothetical protein
MTKAKGHGKHGKAVKAVEDGPEPVNEPVNPVERRAEPEPVEGAPARVQNPEVRRRPAFRGL